MGNAELCTSCIEMRLSFHLLNYRLIDAQKHCYAYHDHTKRGSGGGAPSGVQGQSPWWGVRGLKAFCTFLYKKWPKVKDLSEHLPPPRV